MKTPELETERLVLRFIGSDDFIESSYRWQMTGALAPVISACQRSPCFR